MPEFINLDLDFTNFSFSSTDLKNNYRTGEINILQPQLEKLGYKVIRWYDGERDSFGPLSRVALIEKDGIQYKYCYG